MREWVAEKDRIPIQEDRIVDRAGVRVRYIDAGPPSSEQPTRRGLNRGIEKVVSQHIKEDRMGGGGRWHPPCVENPSAGCSGLRPIDFRRGRDMMTPTQIPTSEIHSGIHAARSATPKGGSTGYQGRYYDPRYLSKNGKKGG